MSGYPINPNRLPFFEQVRQLPLSGSINIPLPWLQRLKTPGGKPYLLAAAILADIVYWHRPIIVRDEISGQFLGLRKRFKNDYLQRSYGAMSRLFGYAAGTCRDAVVYLEEEGFTKRILLNIIVDGKAINNVLHFEIFPKKIAEISIFSQSELAHIKGVVLSPLPGRPKGGSLGVPREAPLASQGTYTEDTTDITTEEKVYCTFCKSADPVTSFKDEDCCAYCFLLKHWERLFPDKPKPRSTTASIRAKVRGRWKHAHFKENCVAALEAAAASPTCQKETWFNFRFFVHNDDNYQKCLDNWMAWKDERQQSASQKDYRAALIQEISAQVTNCGRYGTPTLGQQAEQVVNTLGGWSHVCGLDDFALASQIRQAV